MEIRFFSTRQGTVVAVQSKRRLSPEDGERLSWLLGGASSVKGDRLGGHYVGPRREMVTPWSTNAVEIAQNMNVEGIVRMEEYRPVKGKEAQYDRMLERLYDGLGQDIFEVRRKPEAIRMIDDLDAYNEEEGLALSPEEVEYLRGVEREAGRRLTDSEVFGFAQINSEHCRHKIFGGSFVIDGEEMPLSLFALIKKTTKENPHGIVSAYKDNVAFLPGPVVELFAPRDHSTSDYFRVSDVESVISLKAETHNFPTTVEPFNGAATGTGGEIRDRMGGGTGSWPIAGTAVYMTSYPRTGGGTEGEEGSRPWEEGMSPRQWLYQTPREILIKASNGASDFGNKFGQPLITGSLLTFEHEERGERYGYDKVVMLAGGVGYGRRRDCLKGTPRKGNKIVVVGGDNYRIGLGGGSVSSVETGRYGTGIELNAIQRANPEMQKRAYNLVRALTEEAVNPVVSIHDHGSAGHVNCLSELVEECGGLIDMTRLPIGDTTLSSKEIIANESQERMGLLIDEQHIEHVRRIAERERAPLYVVGETTGDARFAFEQGDGVRPFDLSVAQMFGHSPKTVMRDRTVERTYADASYDQGRLHEYLERVLRMEAVASKDWLTNKVDRSVTGKVARQQCQGRIQLPLSDCGVVALDYRGHRGIATALGHAPQAGLADPGKGSILSVAESLTNIVWAELANGLDSVSLSANWMWPCRSQEGEDARLYEAVKSLSDFCIGLGINVPTGKDSLSMTQKYPDGGKVISPGTVIVSSGAEVSDVRKTVGQVAEGMASTFYLIDFSGDELRLGGSAFSQSLGKVGGDVPTVVDAEAMRRTFNAVQQCVREGLLLSGHDVSAGGLVTCLLEMCFGNTEGGMDICLDPLGTSDMVKALFAENPAVVVQVEEGKASRFEEVMGEASATCLRIGTWAEGRSLRVSLGDRVETFDVDKLRDAWCESSYKLDLGQTAGTLALSRYENYKHQPLTLTFPKGFTGLASQYGISPDRRTESPTKAAIVREKGTNGEREMAYSLYLAGFDVKDVMMTDLVSGRETLEDVNMIVFCGGFSNSDVLGSAKGWAGAFLFNPKAKQALERFYQREDTLSLGICNGCQLMVELGLTGDPEARMEANESHKFESEFVAVRIPENKSVMFGSLSGTSLGLWVAHGEGRFSLGGKEESHNIVARYAYDAYPANPNGSDFATAAICSQDGRHLAMMPHLERAIFPWQCAWYPRERQSDEVTPWIEAFTNARLWVEARKAR